MKIYTPRDKIVHFEEEFYSGLRVVRVTFFTSSPRVLAYFVPNGRDFMDAKPLSLTLEEVINYVERAKHVADPSYVPHVDSNPETEDSFSLNPKEYFKDAVRDQRSQV